MLNPKIPTDLPEILHDVPYEIISTLSDKFHSSSTAEQRVAKLQKTADLLGTFYRQSAHDPLIDEKMEALYTYARKKGHSHVSFTVRGVLDIKLPESAFSFSLNK